MKIIHCISALTLGGAEMMLVKLATHMRSHRVLVVCTTTDEPLGSSLRDAGIPVIALGKRRGRPDPRAVLKLRHILARERPDILQTWMYEANLYGLAAGRLARIPRIVWNLRCTSMNWSEYGRLPALGFHLNGAMSALPDAIVVNSRASLEYHRRQRFRNDVFRVIGNGFDTSRFRPDPAAGARLRSSLGIAAGAPLFGLLARVDPMKDHAGFLQAAARVMRRSPDAHLLLAGHRCDAANPELTRLLDAALAPHEQSRVHLLGGRDNTPEILAGLDVLVLASAFGESFPNVIGEAMACGTPCVATDVGDTRHIIGSTGIVVPPRDAVALAEAVSATLQLPAALRRQRGIAARERVVRHYGIDAIARQYAALYQELLGSEAEPCAA